MTPSPASVSTGPQGLYCDSEANAASGQSSDNDDGVYGKDVSESGECGAIARIRGIFQNSGEAWPCGNFGTRRWQSEPKTAPQCSLSD